ncbi:MAG: phosphate acyltransferase PlsX [Candidatus Dormibacteria bacterium]
MAVDAMGGDRAPEALVDGSLQALLHDSELRLVLVGERARLEGLVSASGGAPSSRLSVADSDGVIAMDAHPVQAVRAQPRASVNVAVDLVAKGQADACFSAGNSGATMAAALLRLHRLPGVARPAIATPLPTRSGTTMLVDSGAQVECRPEWLAQFSTMGSAYVSAVLGVNRPRVGLLSNGEESSKGNSLVQAAHGLISQLGLNYVGPVEGRDLLSGEVDVVVCDGFVGNVALKTAEGVAEAIMAGLRQEAQADLRARLGAVLLLPGLRRLRARLDWRQVGGAPLLGVRGLVFIGHGRSDAAAVASAVGVAAAAVRAGAAQALEAGIARQPQAELVEG